MKLWAIARVQMQSGYLHGCLTFGTWKVMDNKAVNEQEKEAGLAAKEEFIVIAEFSSKVP